MPINEQLPYPCLIKLTKTQPTDFFYKTVRKNFAILTRKHMKSLLNKVADPKACNFIKKRLQHGCFRLFEYCEISKNTYFEEHPRTAASELTLGSVCLGLSF